MKLCYQVATPDVAIAESVTAYQGSLQKSFGDLAALGYDGVELMTLDPGKLNWAEVKETASQCGLFIGLVCTGEIFGQLNLNFTHKDAGVRRDAVDRVMGIIDFAAYLGAKVNIGRVRGQYQPDIPFQQTKEWAIEAFRTISDHALPLGVNIALETVTYMQTNFINTLAEAREMMKAVDRPNFKLMMDVFHLNIEEKDLNSAIREYCADTIHVHLADNNRRYPGHCGLDFGGIIQTFRDCGYDDIFCTEIYQLPSMEEAAKGSITHLAPLFKNIYGRDFK